VERRVRRQPGVGIAECLVEVGFCADGQQIARIVGEIAAALLVPVAGALVPGIRQRDDVIDLDRLGGLGAADEGDGLAGVRVDQDTALGIASDRPDQQLGEITSQDVVAGVAAVVAELDVDVVAPAFAEPVPRKVGHPVPSLDGQPRQLRPRVVVVGRGLGRRAPVGGPPVQPSDHGDRQNKQRDRGNDSGPPGGNDRAHIAVLALEPVEC
jgi:hypothetical protein